VYETAGAVGGLKYDIGGPREMQRRGVPFPCFRNTSEKHDSPGHGGAAAADARGSRTNSSTLHGHQDRIGQINERKQEVDELDGAAKWNRWFQRLGIGGILMSGRRGTARATGVPRRRRVRAGRRIGGYSPARDLLLGIFGAARLVYSSIMPHPTPKLGSDITSRLSRPGGGTVSPAAA